MRIHGWGVASCTQTTPHPWSHVREAGSAPDSEWPLAGLRELGHTLKALSALARSHRAGWLGPERAGGPLHGSARWPADEQKAVGHQPV